MSEEATDPAEYAAQLDKIAEEIRPRHPQRQDFLHIDATPDADYPLRILRAYRQQCDVRTLTTPPELGEQMNEWQDHRAAILDKAILPKPPHCAESRRTGLVKSCPLKTARRRRPAAPRSILVRQKVVEATIQCPAQTAEG